MKNAIGLFGLIAVLSLTQSYVAPKAKDVNKAPEKVSQIEKKKEIPKDHVKNAFR